MMLDAFFRTAILILHGHSNTTMLMLAPGASRYVGASLAEAFFLDKDLILVERNAGTLITARNIGAMKAGYIERDYALAVNYFF